MCLAIPEQITKIQNKIATLEYRIKNKQVEPRDGRNPPIRRAKIITGSYKPGDYVIVQAGLVIEKVPKKQVKMWKEFISNE
ncbi:MAG: HypC/HybG/HupF family hydrogenase formation chaperone [Candidatus Jacksonbacteria bacterium]